MTTPDGFGTLTHDAPSPPRRATSTPPTAQRIGDTVIVGMMIVSARSRTLRTEATEMNELHSAGADPDDDTRGRGRPPSPLEIAQHVLDHGTTIRDAAVLLGVA